MPPRWGELREFCLKQGYWETVTDHFRYLKVLPDRSTSGTMISKGREGEVIPPKMWQQVWRRQLRLASEEEFWKGLRGAPVRYTIPEGAEPEELLPLYLQRFLRDVLHLSESDVQKMGRARAQRLLNEHYARELGEEPESKPKG